MISFDSKYILQKALYFRRLHGTKALINLVLTKLKLKSIKPSEIRFDNNLVADSLVSDACFHTNSFSPACSPLRVYTVPVDVPSRISIVTDSINNGSLYGGVGTAMILTAMLAEARQARLRVVTRTERASTENLYHVLEIYGIKLSQEVEFVFAPFYDKSYEIDIFSDELFITTSWWTTAATMASVNHASIIYLLQEDERMFYPYGDEHLRCAQVMRNKDISFIINTQLLFDHLIADGLENIAENGVWFEPAFPKKLFYPRAKRSSTKRTMMFYARPNNARNLFYFGIELIEEAISRGVIDTSLWDILLVGKNIPNIVFSGDYVPEKCENLTWEDYAELVGTMDLGLCLMYTPHPSYPPLDLAASGAVVVTNRYGNKQDMSKYSKNIVCGDLDRESMILALIEGLRLADSAEERVKNFGLNALGLDWSLAFSNTIQNVCRVH